jgi:hypothetical protein
MDGSVYAKRLIPQQDTSRAAHPELLVHGDWFDSEEKNRASFFAKS